MLNNCSLTSLATPQVNKLLFSSLATNPDITLKSKPKITEQSNKSHLISPLQKLSHLQSIDEKEQMESKLVALNHFFSIIPEPPPKKKKLHHQNKQIGQ
jgi:hypothetical protein